MDSIYFDLTLADRTLVKVFVLIFIGFALVYMLSLPFLVHRFSDFYHRYGVVQIVIFGVILSALGGLSVYHVNKASEENSANLIEAIERDYDLSVTSVEEDDKEDGHRVYELELASDDDQKCYAHVLYERSSYYVNCFIGTTPPTRN